MTPNVELRGRRAVCNGPASAPGSAAGDSERSVTSTDFKE